MRTATFFLLAGSAFAAANSTLVDRVVSTGFVQLDAESFKTLDLQSRRGYPVLALVALGLAIVVAHEIMLVAIAYTYLASGIVMWAWQRLRRHGHEGHEGELATQATKTN